MAMPCSVCAHPNRDQIDRRSIMPGANFAELAREFDLGDSSGRSLHRHFAGHLSARVRQAAERQDRFTAAALITRLGELLDALEGARRVAIDSDDVKSLLAAVTVEFRLLESVSSRVTADAGVEVTTNSVRDYELLRAAVVRVVSDRPVTMLSLRTWLTTNGSEGARLADDIDVEARALRASSAL